MNELPDEENRAKKAVRRQEYTYKAVLGSLRRDCTEPTAIFDLGRRGLVRVSHAPPLVCLDLYAGDMI